MSNEVIKELFAICDLESDDKVVGWRRRRDAMETFINKYFLEVKTSQSVLNPEVFDSETMDFIKEVLAKRLAEDLTTATNYEITNKRISAKLTVLNVNRK
jgi:hypothetical protein